MFKIEGKTSLGRAGTAVNDRISHAHIFSLSNVLHEPRVPIIPTNKPL